MFECFKSIKRLPKICSVGNGAMVGHQQSIVMFDQRPHRIGQLVGRRGPVLCQRNTAESQDYFGKNWLIDWQTGDGERRPIWRMSVTHGLYVWPLAINQ